MQQERLDRGTITQDCGCGALPNELSCHMARLQWVTLGWMSMECAIALVSAWRARSFVLLAFGADSLIELFSALVVLLQFVPRSTLSAARATRLAGVLLLILAAVVGITAALALWLHVQPGTSWLGMGVTVAALLIMPPLSAAKRRAGKSARNAAMMADAVQSATCAYLAAITLAGLGINALFHFAWIDPLAALAAVPIICLEGKRALRGEACDCC